MVYRKLIIKEEPLNNLRKLAYQHNMTPKQWIEDYKISDADVIETIKLILNKDERDIYISVVEEEDNTIGFIWANRESNKKDFMIISLYVSPLYRKRGIASRLKEDFELWCKNNGIKKIKTTVHVTNKKMIKLNEKLGYEPNMISMSKTLNKE